jgi:hypothetical protein
VKEWKNLAKGHLCYIFLNTPEIAAIGTYREFCIIMCVGVIAVAVHVHLLRLCHVATCAVWQLCYYNIPANWLLALRKNLPMYIVQTILHYHGIPPDYVKNDIDRSSVLLTDHAQTKKTDRNKTSSLINDEGGSQIQTHEKHFRYISGIITLFEEVPVV